MALNEYLPLFAMILTQLGYAGMNVIMKLAVDSGMQFQVFVTFRQLFATIAISPFAYFLESRPNLTWRIAMEIFACSVLGATLNQLLYIWGMKYTTATVACAISNTLPAITFIIAIPFKMEKVGIRQRAGQAKLIGTISCVGGAMFLTFYNGPRLNVPESGIHWTYAQKMKQISAASTATSSILGSVLVLGSCSCWAVWFLLQTKLSERYPAPLSSSALMCFLSSLECAAFALIMDHSGPTWSLYPPIRLLSTLYSGIAGSALAFYLMSWAISQKGPLYVSVFSPLLLVMVAVTSWGFLDEKLHVGMAVGSVVIIGGLYSVLWGKKKEVEEALKHQAEKEKEEAAVEETV